MSVWDVLWIAVASVLAVVVPALGIAWLALRYIDRSRRARPETYAQMMARSARLDHELWPDETGWNHPRYCGKCNPNPLAGLGISCAEAANWVAPPPTIAEIGTHVMRHDSDYEWIADARLGQARVERVRGRLKA